MDVLLLCGARAKAMPARAAIFQNAPASVLFYFQFRQVI